MLFIIWMKDTDMKRYSSFPVAYVTAVKNPIGNTCFIQVLKVMWRSSFVWPDTTKAALTTQENKGPVAASAMGNGNPL